MNNKKCMDSNMFNTTLTDAETVNTEQVPKPQSIKTIQKQMAKKLVEEPNNKIIRNIKDSIFCNLFSRPEYLIELYKALHPEDTEITVDDLTLVTLQSTFVKSMYNDLGFLAGNLLFLFHILPVCRPGHILVRPALIGAEMVSGVMYNNNSEHLF